MTSGTIDIPEPASDIPPTPREELDAELQTLRAGALAWAKTDVATRLDLLDELVSTTLAAAPAWTTAAARAKGIRSDSPALGEDWLSGPVLVLRNLTMLQTTLTQVLETGRPQPSAMKVGDHGQVVAEVFPVDWIDTVMLAGFTAEVWLEPGVTLEQAQERMGRIYRADHEPEPAVALVLGAGNVSSIGPMDALYQLFVLGRVVLLKMNPVNSHLGPHIAEAFQPLIRAGFLRVVYGGAEVGAYLTGHDAIDAIHMTGSDKTYDAIVFGAGEEGERRKATGDRRIDAPITAELGNVTPIIVVPGPWSDADVAFQGDHIASMLVQNAGFNCVAARAVIQHRSWTRRRALLDAIRDSLRRAEPREPYYPGALDRWRRFTRAHTTAEWFGPEGDDRVPFTLIPDLDPSVHDDIAFTTESFCAVIGEVALDAPRSVPEYIAAAVEFANETLWGTLSATILVHPRSLKDPQIAAAVDQAIRDLRYGGVVVNQWAAAAYGVLAAPWGAYPGADDTDIQSGRGFVHNAYMLEDVQKTVIRGPWRPPVTPSWFHTNRTLDQQMPRLARLIADRDPKVIPGLAWAAVRG